MTVEGTVRVGNMSDTEFEKKASELCDGENLAIEAETTGTPLEAVDSSVRAILMKMDGSGGAVKVYGEIIRHIVTDNESGFMIVAIKPGETSMLHGKPQIRYFRRR